MLSMFFKKLLLSREATLMEGDVSLFGNSFYLQPISELVFLHNGMKKKFGITGIAVIHESGKRSSKEFFKTIEKFAVRKSDAMKLFMNLLNLYGFGNIEIINIKEKKEVLVEIKDNKFAKEYIKLFGRQKEPVDDLVSGLLAGFFEELWKTRAECKEIMCLSQAKMRCQFKVSC